MMYVIDQRHAGSTADRAVRIVFVIARVRAQQTATAMAITMVGVMLVAAATVM